MKTDKQILAKFASNVKRYREAKGVTQHQAFSDTGIHFGRIEQGNRDVSITTYVKICKYLNCSILDLLK